MVKIVANPNTIKMRFQEPHLEVACNTPDWRTGLDRLARVIEVSQAADNAQTTRESEIHATIKAANLPNYEAAEALVTSDLITYWREKVATNITLKDLLAKIDECKIALQENYNYNCTRMFEIPKYHIDMAVRTTKKLLDRIKKELGGARDKFAGEQVSLLAWNPDFIKYYKRILPPKTKELFEEILSAVKFNPR